MNSYAVNLWTPSFDIVWCIQSNNDTIVPMLRKLVFANEKVVIGQLISTPVYR